MNKQFSEETTEHTKTTEPTETGQQSSANDPHKLNDMRYDKSKDYSRESYYGRRFQNARSGKGRESYRAYNHPGWKAPGPFRGIGPRGYHRRDETIYEDVGERLQRHGMIDAGKVRVTVNNGMVTLTGTVNSRWEKRTIQEIVEMVPGVVDYQNEVRVSKAGTDKLGQPVESRSGRRGQL